VEPALSYGLLDLAGRTDEHQIRLLDGEPSHRRFFSRIQSQLVNIQKHPSRWDRLLSDQVEQNQIGPPGCRNHKTSTPSQQTPVEPDCLHATEAPGKIRPDLDAGIPCPCQPRFAPDPHTKAKALAGRAEALHDNAAMAGITDERRLDNMDNPVTHEKRLRISQTFL
jgi:hypothetical protein